MNIFEDFTDRIRTIVQSLPGTAQLPAADLARIIVEPPRDATHGDLASNAAMVLAKPLGLKPRDLATRIGMASRARPRRRGGRSRRPGLRQYPAAAGLSAEGAGVACRARARPTAVRGPARGRRSMSSMSRPIPTGPMHVGHCRGAVFGDALANLLDSAGYEVTREYYINDAGAQVDILARSALLRYREALGEEIGPIPGRPLSWRLSQARRRGAGARVRHAAPRDARSRVAAARPRHRRPHDDGDDPGRPEGARHRARGLLLRAVADRRRPERGRRR